MPSPGVWWRRRRRRRAPPRSYSTLWGGKAARNLPDPPLHPPPSLLLLPSPSLLQAFTTFLPETSSYHRPVQWLHFASGWQRSRREIKPWEQCKGEGNSSPARPRQLAARTAGRGGEKGEPGGWCPAAPPRRRVPIPAPGLRPLQPRQRRLHPPGLRAAFAPNCGGSRPAGGFFLGAKGLITVRHSRESVCGSGWGVKKANQSGFGY